MDWFRKLNEDERTVVFASIFHCLDNADLDLNEAQAAVADKMFSDLDKAMNDGTHEGYAARVPQSDHQMLWAMVCAFYNDIHAPMDQLPPEAWDRAEIIFEVLNTWNESELSPR